MGSIKPLLGRSVLIVEDEPFTALELHEALRPSGASILAATSVKAALHLIGYAHICAAIVDATWVVKIAQAFVPHSRDGQSLSCSTRATRQRPPWRPGLPRLQSLSPRRRTPSSRPSPGSSSLRCGLDAHAVGWKFGLSRKPFSCQYRPREECVRRPQRCSAQLVGLWHGVMLRQRAWANFG